MCNGTTEEDATVKQADLCNKMSERLRKWRELSTSKRVKDGGWKKTVQDAIRPLPSQSGGEKTTPLYEMEIILCRNLIRETPDSRTASKWLTEEDCYTEINGIKSIHNIVRFLAYSAAEAKSWQPVYIFVSRLWKDPFLEQLKGPWKISVEWPQIDNCHLYFFFSLEINDPDTPELVGVRQ